MIRIDRIRGHSFIADWLGADCLIIDLGMNRGDFAREIQQKYGSRVLGVEANPALISAISHRDRLEVLNYAVGVSAGSVAFHINIHNSEMSSLLSLRQDDREVVVPGITLAELFGIGGVTDVSLLKVDIEGAEIGLLQSAPLEVLLKARQISVEFHVFMGKGTSRDVAEIIKRMERIGFFALDFSRTYEDVLFINTRYFPLSTGCRLSLLFQKYGAGLSRVWQRQVARGERARS